MIMNEKQFILSQQNNVAVMTMAMPKSVFVRVVAFFTEKFDAVSLFVAKWTF
jgi:hypothetical protein